ncbi:glycosyltransferase family 2 protein [Deinococcus sp. KNUC1210]|uniref:glycosyltransferase family 2 protein n=1 Tax=Deinococcus sp. KNUC1210 TaxID=2917691 RepID=UPI001EEFF824|nr:glycosyltransferase family 2 protein [Deinococcus sp. KNUC1210]ULH16404.1 glycosyltransferase family 2 protein [Deinococcus sp. KNUC1210]
MTHSSIAVVIPAYNEAQTVADVVRVALLLTPLVIVASDGSTDGTAQVARDAGAQVVELTQNVGKGPALYAGLKAAEGHADYVLMLDADLLGLTPTHLDILLRPVQSGKLDMSIGIFDGGGLMTDLGNKLTPHLSGQRACRLRWLLNVPGLGQERWPEPAITDALKRSGVRWDYVELPQLGQVMKEEKRGFWKGVGYRSRMYVDLLGYRRRKKKSEKDSERR